jgi:thiol-disulfide isomerase/thioredoxin
MKYSLSLLSLPLILLMACANSNSASSKNFELKGKLSNAANQMIYLEQMLPSGMIKIDSLTIPENGEFTLKTNLPEDGFYRLKITEQNFATLVLSKDDKVNITGNAQDLGNTYKVQGSIDSQLFWELNTQSSKNYHQRDSIQKTFEAFAAAVQDKTRVDSLGNALDKPYTALLDQHNNYLKKFVETNSTSLASLAAIQQLPADKFLATYILLDQNLYKKYPASPYLKSFHQNVESQKNLAIGSEAPDFTMNQPDGKPLSLKSLRGKYVLIDFWASWCGPCRAENPNVVAAYNKYKTKGFDILSVSLDKDADKWKAAIAKDGLIWNNHVSDLQYWQSPIVQLYNFNAIPTNVLIDKEGKILAKNLRGEELENKLAEAIK